MDKYFFVITLMSAHSGPSAYSTVSGELTLPASSPQGRYAEIFETACTKFGFPATRASTIFYHIEKM